MIWMECRKRSLVPSGLFLIAVLASVGSRAVAQSTTQPDRTTLPIAPPPFSGTITPDYQSSSASRRAADCTRRRAERSADSARRCGLRTDRNLRRHDPDADARQPRAQGLRYTRFHVTALCSPTRSALMTGRNNHAWAWARSPTGPTISRLHGIDSEERGVRLRDSARERLRDRGVRQVALIPDAETTLAGHTITGRRTRATTISTASSAPKPTNGIPS